MAAFNLAVVPGRERTDQLVPDPQLLQCTLKQSRFRNLIEDAIEDIEYVETIQFPATGKAGIVPGGQILQKIR